MNYKLSQKIRWVALASFGISSLLWISLDLYIHYNLPYWQSYMTYSWITGIAFLHVFVFFLLLVLIDRRERFKVVSEESKVKQ